MVRVRMRKMSIWKRRGRSKSLQSCSTLRPCGLWPARLLCSWDSPGENGLLCPPRGISPHPGIEPASLRSSASGGDFFTTSATWEAHLEDGSTRIS